MCLSFKIWKCHLALASEIYLLFIYKHFIYPTDLFQQAYNKYFCSVIKVFLRNQIFNAINKNITSYFHSRFNFIYVFSCRIEAQAGRSRPAAIKTAPFGWRCFIFAVFSRPKQGRNNFELDLFKFWCVNRGARKTRLSRIAEKLPEQINQL